MRCLILLANFNVRPPAVLTPVLLLCLLQLIPSTTWAQRDPWQWPFAKTSIWNMPIGSEAVYVPANLEPSYSVGVDVQLLLKLDANDPQRPVLATYDFKKDRCSSSDELGFSLPFPDDYVVPDAGNSPYGLTPNSNFALLLPGDSTLFQGQLLTRCTAGGPIHMGAWYRYANNRNYVSIYGSGNTGADGQGASGMSNLGGTLRKGELTGKAPIRHAIKINPFAQKYLYYSNAVPGYRWPATRADNYASDANQYLGDNPKLVMGSLLAIPPNVTAESLNLTTEAGKKLFFTLQNYGAYFTEDAAWDHYDLIVERDAELEFEAQYGFSLESDTWKYDFFKLIQSLYIIDNNSPTSIGGGGTPRQPLAPDFDSPTNLLANESFEADSAQVQSITGWQTWSSTGSEEADYTESYGSQTDGDYHLTHYRGRTGTWNCYTTQLLTDLPNGTYRLQAKARKSGNGFQTVQIEAKGFGGPKRSSAIPTSTTMQLVEVRNIQVTNGRCQVGLWTSVENGSNWPYVHLDEFRLIRVSPTGAQTEARTVAVVAPTPQQPLSAYPNPSADGIFYVPALGVKSGYLLITDLSGRRLSNLPLRPTTRVDLSDQTPGVYLMRSTHGRSGRLVKQK